MTGELPDLEAFLQHLKAKGYSAHTLANYRRGLELFGRFLKLEGLAFGRADRPAIERFKTCLTNPDHDQLLAGQPRGRGHSPRALNNILTAIRAYLRYLADQGRPVPLPPEAVERPRAGRARHRIPSLEELMRLLEAPEQLERDPRVALRNRAILEVLFATGLRLAELCDLNRDQLGPGGALYVRGRRPRTVYLTPRALEALERYLAIRTDPEPALFIPYPAGHDPSPGRRLSPDAVQLMLRRYRSWLGLKVPITPYTLRAAFAYYLAEAGADRATLQRLLGHVDPKSTPKYLRQLAPRPD